MEGSGERYRLSLNISGIDYQIEVDDINLANLLINDQKAALQYICENEELDLTEVNLTQESNSDGYTYESENLGHVSDSMSVNVGQDESEDDMFQKEEIWKKKKPTENDLRASEELIRLRSEFATQFDDRKTIKMKLWERISIIMKKKYYLGEGHGALKCRQKWSNLMKSAISYVQHQKKTGSGFLQEPPFFKEVYGIIGNKHKVHPVHLEDSLESNKEKPEEFEQSNCLPSTSKKTSPKKVGRFNKECKVNKPPSTPIVLKNYFDEQRIFQKEQFQQFNEHLVKSYEQRDRFLNILEKYFQKTDRKRKREFSSDSE